MSTLFGLQLDAYENDRNEEGWISYHALKGLHTVLKVASSGSGAMSLQDDVRNLTPMFELAGGLIILQHLEASKDEIEKPLAQLKRSYTWLLLSTGQSNPGIKRPLLS